MSAQREILATLSRGKSDSVEWCATCGVEIEAQDTRAMLESDGGKHHFCESAHAKMYVRGQYARGVLLRTGIKAEAHDESGREFLRAMGVL